MFAGWFGSRQAGLEYHKQDPELGSEGAFLQKLKRLDIL
jgi:hypothetical protein